MIEPINALPITIPSHEIKVERDILVPSEEELPICLPLHTIPLLISSVIKNKPMITFPIMMAMSKEKI